jgi:hypothetical protein
MGATNSTARKSKQATSHPTLLWTSQDINPQSSSPLFYLPLELQLRIYEYLFGQRRIHLFWEPMTARQKRKSKPTQTQLAYYQVCQHPPPTNTNFWETWTCCPRSGGRTRELTKPGCEVSHALLYSCRKACVIRTQSIFSIKTELMPLTVIIKVSMYCTEPTPFN